MTAHQMKRLIQESLATAQKWKEIYEQQDDPGSLLTKATCQIEAYKSLLDRIKQEENDNRTD